VSDTRYLYLLISVKSLLLFNILFNISVFCRKRVQRYNHFPNWQNIFSKKICKTSEPPENQHKQNRKNFFHIPLRSPQNTPPPPRFHQKSAPSAPKNRKIGEKTKYLAHNQHFEQKQAGFRTPSKTGIRAPFPYTSYILPIYFLYHLYKKYMRSI